MATNPVTLAIEVALYVIFEVNSLTNLNLYIKNEDIFNVSRERERERGFDIVL